MEILCVQTVNTKISVKIGVDVLTLANKYRPAKFEDVVEQGIVTDIIQVMCNSGFPNRNILLTGPAGVGKTTTARIIGNTLNDGICEPIEIDAASNSGVDAMRDIVQQAKSYPIDGKYKIIIIDECHSLSNQAWQALLKVLEESPAKTVFIFCTTNPEKIPNTIISRVQVFRLSKISLNGIYQRLSDIIDLENIEGAEISYDRDGLMLISKLANGGMRDALTLLDKVIIHSKTINSHSVSEALCLPNYDDYFKLLGAINKRDNKLIIDIVDSVYNSGINFVKWFDDFYGFVVNVVKFVFSQDIEKTIIPAHYADKLSKYTPAHASICLRLSNILVRLNSDLKNSNYQQEIAMSYLCSSTKG